MNKEATFWRRLAERWGTEIAKRRAETTLLYEEAKHWAIAAEEQAYEIEYYRQQIATIQPSIVVKAGAVVEDYERRRE